MAYITPNSDVILCKGVPLDKDYNHTLYNTDASSQYNTIQYYREYTLTQQSYQRYSRNSIRVAKLADLLYECNYMMFRNTAYGSKWFYAFITNIEYVNDNCSEITYEIDVMQTWYFDYEMGQCFVEREHTETDNIGENLIPEDVETGDLIPQRTWEFTYPDSINPQSPMYELVILYVPNEKYITGITYIQGRWEFTTRDTTDGDGNKDIGQIVNGIYIGCKFWSVTMLLGADVSSTRTEIDAVIGWILANSGAIVNIIQVPYILWNDWLVNGGSTATRSSNSFMETKCFNPNHTSYYTPKNKKLYTSPFKSVIVSNNCGQTAVYKWEYFSLPSQATFKITGVPIISPEIMCYPYQYRGITDDYESGLVLTDFPQPPWSEDSFAKWWAQNKEAYILSLVSTAVMAVGAIAGTIATGGTAGIAGATIAGTALSAGSKIAGSVGQYTSQKNTPDQISGQASVSSIRTVQRRIGFKFYDMGVEKDKAQMIDNYFSEFGYAIKQVKVPNIRKPNAHLRPHWNYIRTNGCILHGKQGQVSGGLPADAEAKISKIYDNGITFWNSLDEVGYYSLDNSPT